MAPQTYTLEDVRDWPKGTRFRVDNVLYTKVHDGPGIHDVTVVTFRNGEDRQVVQTISPSAVVLLVDFGRK